MQDLQTQMEELRSAQAERNKRDLAEQRRSLGAQSVSCIKELYDLQQERCVWSLCVSEPFKRHCWGVFWKRKEKKQRSTELRVPVCCLVLCVLAPWCWLDTLRSIIQRLIPPWCPQCTQSYTLGLLQPTTCHNTLHREKTWALHLDLNCDPTKPSQQDLQYSVYTHKTHL